MVKQEPVEWMGGINQENAGNNMAAMASMFAQLQALAAVKQETFENMPWFPDNKKVFTIF